MPCVTRAAAMAGEEPKRMRILHLAYEDPRQPGSGGGAVRTWEINRRLSDHHQITALVAGYPQARERVEGGVHWVPIGTGVGGKLDRLLYFGLLQAEIRRHPHDLLVEDFSAPFSTAFSPWFTDKPIVASVQWLFSTQMRVRYHLPFDWVERFGLRFYNNFITVSDWIGTKIRAARPDATIETIPPGIANMAFSVNAKSPRYLLFVGRLERHSKGTDLLLDSFARLRTLLGEATPPLVIVGDGEDRAMMERHTERLGIASLVEFRGRVDGMQKFQLMANAYAVLVPSRYETFGMVAVESQAVGTPVVAFRVGALSESTGTQGIHLVSPFDLQAFACTVADLIKNPENATDQRAARRQWATQYDWDYTATKQEKHYLAAMEHYANTSARRHSDTLR